jgi:hypothetical protein
MVVRVRFALLVIVMSALFGMMGTAQAAGLSQIQPTPQFVLNGPTTQTLKIDAETPLAAQVSVAGRAELAIFRQQLNRLTKLDIRLDTAPTPENKGRFTLLLKKNDTWIGPQVWPDAPKKTEGYALVIEEGGIALSGNDSRGFFYGLQTILQLCMHATESDGQIPTARISDWPALSERTTLLIIKNLRRDGNIEYVKNLLAGLASMKYNSVFLQFDSAVPGPKYAFPETVKNPLTDAQVTDICATARKYHLDVNLAFQFGAHCTWMLAEPAYSKFGENFDQPFSWDNSNLCPLNADLWKVIADLVEHQMKLCQPKYVHIAHDEIGHGEFAEHPLCKNSGLSKEELIATSLRKLRQIIPANKAKMIMWHDLLMPDAFKSPPYLGVVNGPKLLDLVPPGVEIAIWDYAGSANHIPAIEYFTGHRRKFWVSTFEAAGASKVASYGDMYGGNGLIATHWHEGGFCTWDSPTSFSAAAMNATVAAAALAWNPREDAALTSNVDRVKIFHDAVEGMQPRIANADWSSLKLPTGPASSPDTSPSSASDSVLATFLNSLPGHLTTDSGIPFERFKQPIILAGGKGQTDEAARKKTITVGQDVVAVHFLHSCDTPAAEAGMSSWQAAQSRPEIGSYRLKFSEGEDVVIPLQYRWNIQDWNALQGAYATQIAWQGTFKQGISAKLTQASWTAPDNRARKLESIEFVSTTELGLSPALVGVTLQVPASKTNSSTDGLKDIDHVVFAENFDYDATQLLLNQWDGYELNAKVVKDGPGFKSAVEINLPANKGTTTDRLNFGKKNLNVDLSKANTLSLRMKTQMQPGDAVTCIVYLGNTKGEQSYWMYYGLTIDSQWQRLTLPLGSAVTEGTKPADGKSTVDTIMIAFWHKNQSPINVTIDDFTIGRYIGPEVFNTIPQTPTIHRIDLDSGKK